MHVVYEAENVIDAHLVRGRLEGAGVQAFVIGDHLAGAMGELPVSGLIAVGVTSVDLELATSLLAEWRAEVVDPEALDDDAEQAPDWPTFIQA